MPGGAADQSGGHDRRGPARLIGMRYPARDGVLMLTAVTTRGPSALVVTFEDSSGMASAERADRTAFREVLAGIRLRA